MGYVAGPVKTPNPTKGGPLRGGRTTLETRGFPVYSDTGVHRRQPREVGGVCGVREHTVWRTSTPEDTREEGYPVDGGAGVRVHLQRCTFPDQEVDLKGTDVPE